MLARTCGIMSLRRSARSTSRTLINGSNSGPKPPPIVVKKRGAEGTINEGINKKLRTSQKSAEAASNGQPKKRESEPTFAVPALPVTPLRTRRVRNSKVPPLTPTPSLVNIIRAPYRSGDVDDATPPPDRPVEPHITNATLVTPGGTQAVAYPNSLPESTPSKIDILPRPTATTGTLLDKACAHLIKVDPRIKSLVEKHHCAIFSAKGLAEAIDPFRSLASGICGQQVSGAAAKSIKNKFIALFNEGNDGIHKFPNPIQVVATDIARLRLAGLSQRKAEYIHGLAEKFVSGELSTEMLMKASDEEVMDRLIAVRGLGKWSVEMFACFGLKRLDILSTGDLGVQRGMAAYFGKDVKKLKAKGGGKWKYMSEQDMLEKSAIYAPYRSLFMWYMWRVEDVDIAVLETGG